MDKKVRDNNKLDRLVDEYGYKEILLMLVAKSAKDCDHGIGVKVMNKINGEIAKAYNNIVEYEDELKKDFDRLYGV